MADQSESGRTDADLREMVPRELLAEFQEDLRALARSHLTRERVGHTLQPTALVNELWLRVAASPDLVFESKNALLAFASRVYRSILIDHARRRSADVRGGDRRREPLTEQSQDVRRHPPEAELAWSHRMLELDEALDLLARTHPRSAEVFELRFFGGMTCEHIGQLLGVTDRTVRSDYAAACGWLARHLDA